jgi:hypothetical protein
MVGATGLRLRLESSAPPRPMLPFAGPRGSRRGSCRSPLCVAKVCFFYRSELKLSDVQNRACLIHRAYHMQIWASDFRLAHKHAQHFENFIGWRDDNSMASYGRYYGWSIRNHLQSSGTDLPGCYGCHITESCPWKCQRDVATHYKREPRKIVICDLSLKPAPEDPIDRVKSKFEGQMALPVSSYLNFVVRTLATQGRQTAARKAEHIARFRG